MSKSDHQIVLSAAGPFRGLVARYRKIHSDCYMLETGFWKHIKNKLFIECLLWKLNIHRTVNHIRYFEDNENDIIAALGEDLGELEENGECFKQYMLDSNIMRDEEISKLQSIDSKKRTAKQARRLKTIQDSKNENRIHDGAYVLYYGKNHPSNHLQATDFKGSRWVESRGLSKLLNESYFATKDRSKWKQESNFEKPLEPMTQETRTQELDAFINRMIEKGRSANNMNRLRIYLKQCIDWYHGFRPRRWNTTPEYRYRWIKHFEWITGSPALYAAKVSLAPDDFILVEPVQIDTTLYSMPKVIGEEDCGLDEKHVFDQDKTKLVIKDLKPKARVHLHAVCSCGENHILEKNLKSPNVSERAYSKYGRTCRDIFDTMKLKDPGMTSYEFPLHARECFIDGYHIKEDPWVLVKNKKYKRRVCQVTETSMRKVWDNRYKPLEDIVDDILPHYLSPCIEDINKLYPADKPLKEFTKVEKNARRNFVRAKNKGKKRGVKRELRCKTPRTPLKSRPPFLECHKYHRKLTTPKCTVGELMESKGITPSLAAEILNAAYFKSKIKYVLWEERDKIEDADVVHLTDFKSGIGLPFRDKIDVRFTKTQKRLVLTMFACKGLHLHDKLIEVV
jgi:hypothetical protein